MDHLIVNSYLCVCLLFILVLVWTQHNRRTVMLFSSRNIFLLGFSYFQIISVLYWIADPTIESTRWAILKPNNDLVHFSLMSGLFLFFFIITYRKFKFVERRSHKFTFLSGAESDSFLLLVALGMFIASAGLRLGIGNRYVAVLGLYVGVGMGTASCGLVAWVLAIRYKNPVILLYGVGIFSLNMLGQIGGFSRRGLLSMALAMLWALFYRKVHVKRTGQLLLVLAVMSIPSFLIISGFTATRTRKFTQENAISKFTIETIKAGATRIVGPTDTGPISLWLIENYPENFEYRHMFTPMNTFGHFYPRAMWKNKPITLSYLAVKQSGMKRMGSSFNVGPGIIGHAAAEGGYYAVIIYAILGGMMTKFIDELAKFNYLNPYIIVPLGAALSEVFASARGETSYMIGVGAAGVLGVFLFMTAIVKLTGSRMPSRQLHR